MIARYPVPTGFPIPEGLLNGVAECGFNTVMAIGTVGLLEQLMNQRDKCDPTESDADFTRHSLYGKGLRAILHNSDLMNVSKYAGIVEKFAPSPLTAGWFLKDSPQASEVAVTRSMMEKVYEKSGGELVVVQLIESMVGGYTDGYSDYQAYLQGMKSRLAPSVWLTSMNPYMVVNGQVSCNLGLLYGNLEAMRKVATADAPMWTNFHTNSSVSSTVVRPVLTEEMVRLQVFSALAYGAKGLVGNMYCIQPSRPGVTFLSALVNEEGERFPAWQSVRNVLHEVRKYTDVFLGTEVMRSLNSLSYDIRHTGKTQYSGTTMLGAAGNGCVHSISGPDTGVLVSHLGQKASSSGNYDTEKYEYIVIVNHSFKEYQELQLQLYAYPSLEELTPVPVAAASELVSSTTYPKPIIKISRTLAPGGYLIFRYKQ